MRRNFIALFILLACGVFSIRAEEVPPACASMVQAIGVPVIKGNRADHSLLCRLGYVLAHDSEYKTPSWVIEHLTPDRFTGPGDRKAQGNPFAPDPDLSKGNRAELEDYKSKLPNKRSFDRGHMAPAASMKFAEKAMTESFYLSNMAPQQGIGLNRHIWADLEGIMRDWTCERGELYVITGPIYDTEDFDLLGPNQVAVPTAFYKIAYDPSRQRLIAFILPNEKVDKQGQKAWDALQPFIVTLRNVEARAGLTLFKGIGAREKNRLSRMRSVMWPIRKPC